MMNLLPNQIPGSWQVPSAAFLATLPTDLDALRARLYDETRGRGNSVDGEAFVYVADLLRSATVPADITKRMYALLRTIPGVDALPVTVAGRSGTVLGYDQGPGIGDQQLVIDSNSGQLLAEKGTDNTWVGIHRTLVDTIPADLQATAVHHNCQLMDGNGIVCTKPADK